MIYAGYFLLGATVGGWVAAIVILKAVKWR